MKEENLFNIRLLREIEKYPSLYNYNLTEYTSRDTSDKAWTEIGEKLKKSPEDCKNRWKNLRGSLTRNLGQRLRPTGSKVPKTFYLTKYMQFILPFAKSRQGLTYESLTIEDSEETDNLETNLDANSASKQDSRDSWKVINVKDNVEFFDENEESSETGMPQTAIVLTKSSPIAVPTSSTPIKDPLETHCEPINRIEQPPTSDHNDADKHFLLSLLPHIHCLSATEKLQFQIRTLNVINEIMSGRENSNK